MVLTAPPCLLLGHTNHIAAQHSSTHPRANRQPAIKPLCCPSGPLETQQLEMKFEESQLGRRNQSTDELARCHRVELRDFITLLCVRWYQHTVQRALSTTQSPPSSATN